MPQVQDKILELTQKWKNLHFLQPFATPVLTTVALFRLCSDAREADQCQRGRHEALFQPKAIPAAPATCIENYRGPFCMDGRLHNPLRTPLRNYWRGNWNMPFHKVRLRQDWHLQLVMFNMASRGFTGPSYSSIVRNHGFITFLLHAASLCEPAALKPGCLVVKKSLWKRVLIVIYSSVGADWLWLITSMNLRGMFLLKIHREKQPRMMQMTMNRTDTKQTSSELTP